MSFVTNDIRLILESVSALNLTFATNLFIGREPTAPDDCVTLYTGGTSPRGVHLQGASGYDRQSFQVRVRANDYTTGMNLAEDIIEALHGRHQEQWGDSLYFAIMHQNGPELISWDENDRAIIVMNFNVERK